MSTDPRPAPSYLPTPRLFARIAHLTQMKRVADEIRGISATDDEILRGFLAYALSDRGHSIAQSLDDPGSLELLDCKAVAGIFGVDERTVRRWAAEGHLPHSSPGSTYMFTHRDIAELRANRRRSA
jgi:phage terminase Nu1 subunit (DNA packaging protein)